VSGSFAPPQPTTLPHYGAVFKKSPLESDLDTPTPAAPLAAAPAGAETPTADASPTAAPAATADAAGTATVQPGASPTPSAAPATATPQPAATEPPAATAAAVSAATDAPTPEPPAADAPTPEAAAGDAAGADGRAPRIVQPQPQPGEAVDSGAVTFSVRVRADSPLTIIKAAVDNQRQDATLEQVSDGVWVVHFQATLDAGAHRVWVRARDDADREGSFAWQVEAS
jgi:hypothetical protein